MEPARGGILDDGDDDDWCSKIRPMSDLSSLMDGADQDDDDTISEASEISSQYGGDEITTLICITEALDKSPEERIPEDVEAVLDYTQHFPAFSNMTLSVKRKLCTVMEVEKHHQPGSTVIRSGEEVDSWWVVFCGSVELNKDGDVQVLQVGDSFGVTRGSSKRKLVQVGTITTSVRETTLLRVPTAKYFDILSQIEQSTVKVEENGEVVLVKEFAEEVCTHVAVRATPEQLLLRLLEEEEHPHYAEDFLLGHRTFVNSETIAARLCDWFLDCPEVRDRVARIFLLWVNNHIDDFDGKDNMLVLIERFRKQLQDVGMKGQHQLLHMACQVRPALLGSSPAMSPSIAPLTPRSNIVGEDMIMSISPPPERTSTFSHRQSIRLMKLPFGKSRTRSEKHPRRTGRGETVSASSSNSTISTSTDEASSETGNTSTSTNGSRSSVPAINVSTTPQMTPIQSTTPEATITLKIFKPDHSYRFVPVVTETTAEQLLRSALKQFDSHDDVANFSLCRITVTPEGLVKQTRLPSMYHSLPSHLTLTSRYYIKNNVTTSNLVHGDDLLQEMLAEGATDFLSLEPRDIARAITLQDFAVYRQITPVEYIDDLWSLEKSSPNDGLKRFSETTNREMFWVVNEILNEPSLAQRVRIIKQFLKIAKLCRRVSNFNTMFAIISGLSYSAIGRLRTTWAKVGPRHLKMVSEFQELMNPSHNMFNYRRLLKPAKAPIIPFFPVLKKDITFLYLGNNNKVDGLVNFEKVRMIAHEIRTFMGFHSVNYNQDTLLVANPTQSSRVKTNQYDQWMAERRISQYLANLEVNTNENELKQKATELEAAARA